MTLKININLLQDNNGVAGDPIPQDRISVNDSFFVEIEVADVRDNPEGVIGLALDIQWDASVLEALDTDVTKTFTSNFPLNPEGTIDNANGLIKSLASGAFPPFGQGSAIGINGPERFALLHFKGELVTENPIPLTVTISDPRKVGVIGINNFNETDADIEAQTIEITPENTSPTLENPLADDKATEDSEFSLTIPENTFKDSDEGDSLTYSATLEDGRELPSWLTFSTATKTFSGTPSNSDVGTLNVKVTALDNTGEKISDIFVLTVENVDDEPVVQNELADVEVDEDADNSVIDLSTVFSDIDNNDNAIVKIVSANSNEDLVTATIDGNNLTLDYLDNQFGTADITIEGTSNGKSVTDTFKVNVNPIDDLPVVSNEIEDITVNENAANQVIDLSNVFSDVDGDEIILAVKSNTKDSLVTTALDGNNLTLDFLDDQFGNSEIIIEATANGEKVEDTFTVTVNEVPDALISIADSSGDSDDAVIEFTTNLSQFRDGVEDSDLVRPSYPDTQQYIDITNTGEGSLNISEIRLNVPGVTAELPTEDILLNPNETQRIQLTYAPSEAGENFSVEDGLTIISNAANNPEMSVSLSGKSTFDSDINYDDLVSFGDLGPLNANWGRENTGANWDATADINGDGLVNGDDFEVLNQQWNEELTFI